MKRFESLIEKSYLDLDDKQIDILKKEIKGISFNKNDYLKQILDESVTCDRTNRQNIYKIYLTVEPNDDIFNNCDRYICTM